ncbi:MAG TPA: DEAD/DEAH box helicase family protein, partial [Bacteroidales bacterium]|nr:DEAD/DEAH box helicase family protein [Bacteroidales bacterium]
MDFQLQAPFSPSGDQPEAIEQLVKSLNQGVKNQTLLGVTGSGKTFTIANVLQEVKRPALVISHNKTLAAQLYSEFKEFFPHNAVEYFVSYYDYYQPEAYIPSTNTYIEKDLSINEEIERLRLSTTSSLLSGRKDIIVVSSVSCIYGIGNPEEFAKNTIHLHQGFTISRNQLLHQLVSSLYSRTEEVIARAKFRVKGDIVDIFPAHGEVAYRLTFWGDTIESIEAIDPLNGHRIESLNELTIYPANIFVTSQDIIHEAIREIQIDLELQKNYFKSIDKHLEAKRLEDRVIYDIEMI